MAQSKPATSLLGPPDLPGRLPSHHNGVGVGSTPSPTWCGGPPSHAPHTLGARVVGGLRHPAAAQGGRYPADGFHRCCGCRGHQACLQLRAWVALLSACVISVGYQGGWNARIAFRRLPSNLLVQGSMPAGGAAPRRATRNPDIHSRPAEAIFVRIRARSCIDRPTPAEVPFWCAPRRSARHRARSGSD